MKLNLPKIHFKLFNRIYQDFINEPEYIKKSCAIRKISMQTRILELDNITYLFTGVPISGILTSKKIDYLTRYNENRTIPQILRQHKKLIIHKEFILKNLKNPMLMEKPFRRTIINNNKLIIRDLRRARIDKKQKRIRFRCTLDRRRSDQEVSTILDLMELPVGGISYAIKKKKLKKLFTNKRNKEKRVFKTVKADLIKEKLRLSLEPSFDERLNLNESLSESSNFNLKLNESLNESLSKKPNIIKNKKKRKNIYGNASSTKAKRRVIRIEQEKRRKTLKNEKLIKEELKFKFVSNFDEKFNLNLNESLSESLNESLNERPNNINLEVLKKDQKKLSTGERAVEQYFMRQEQRERERKGKVQKTLRIEEANLKEEELRLRLEPSFDERLTASLNESSKDSFEININLID